jgi:hypothetical protein
MDTTEAFRTVENSLRDFLSIVLKAKLGDDWIDKCGVTGDRIIKWKERRVEEKKRLKNIAIDERLIYYADFYDLSIIIQKNWDGEIKQALGELATVKVFLGILQDYRDTDAHRRGLLPHQENLVVGISGEIRSRLVLYRSKMETGDDVFPQLESVRDNYGNTWIPEKIGILDTGLTLRPGDYLEFIVEATDPLGSKIFYSILGDTEWQDSNQLGLQLTTNHIKKKFEPIIAIKSDRDYHANRDRDDVAIFSYTVLPSKKT